MSFSESWREPMKVYDRNLTGAGAAESGRTSETQRTDRFSPAGGTSSAHGAYGDRVELSSSLGRLAGVMTDFSASRAAKVQALAQQYQSGTYRPDSAATSRAMISEALNAGVE
jgi:hypothetical protein